MQLHCVNCTPWRVLFGCRHFYWTSHSLPLDDDSFGRRFANLLCNFLQKVSKKKRNKCTATVAANQVNKTCFYLRFTFVTESVCLYLMKCYQIALSDNRAIRLQESRITTFISVSNIPSNILDIHILRIGLTFSTSKLFIKHIFITNEKYSTVVLCTETSLALHHISGQIRVQTQCHLHCSTTEELESNGTSTERWHLYYKVESRIAWSAQYNQLISHEENTLSYFYAPSS